MKNKILGLTVIAIIATIEVNLSINKQNTKMGLLIENVEALAEPETTDTEKQFQIGEKTITNAAKYSTTEAGWTWNVSAKAWFFNGSISKSWPSTYKEESSSETIKIKCCRPQGPEKVCSYENC